MDGGKKGGREWDMDKGVEKREYNNNTLLCKHCQILDHCSALERS